MQQRDGIDQREILFMVAPVTGLGTNEAELFSVRIVNPQWPQQPLCILMQLRDLGRFEFLLKAFQGAGEALLSVNGGGLRWAFIDADDQAAVHQFRIDVGGRGCEQQCHRSFDGVAFGRSPPSAFLLGSRYERQRAFALQQLELVAGVADAFLFGDRQYLVLQILSRRDSTGSGWSWPNS